MTSKTDTTQSEQEERKAGSLRRKKPFEKPKLKFIEPKLTKHGDATKITQQGFFGTFNP